MGNHLKPRIGKTVSDVVDDVRQYRRMLFPCLLGHRLSIGTPLSASNKERHELPWRLERRNSSFSDVAKTRTFQMIEPVERSGAKDTGEAMWETAHAFFYVEGGRSGPASSIVFHTIERVGPGFLLNHDRAYDFGSGCSKAKMHSLHKGRLVRHRL